MSLDVRIEIDDRSRLAELARRAPHMTARALNKAARQTRTHISKIVRQTYNIRKAELDAGMILRRATPQHEVAVLSVKGSLLPLILFSARQTRQGVTFAILRGKRARIGDAFIATMPSGHEGVFRRKPGWKHKRLGPGRWHGLPIQEPRTISVAHMVGSRKIFTEAAHFFHERFPIVFEQEIRFEALRRITL